jgi:hypothetical protein
MVAGGQTTTANFGGDGRPVIGKFVLPPGMNVSAASINARARPMPATDRRQYLLQIDPKLNFRIDDVPPGQYQISILLQSPGQNRTRQAAQPAFTMPDIPGGVSDEPLVIADIQLQPVPAQ